MQRVTYRRLDNVPQMEEMVMVYVFMILVYSDSTCTTRDVRVKQVSPYTGSMGDAIRLWYTSSIYCACVRMCARKY